MLLGKTRSQILDYISKIDCNIRYSGKVITADKTSVRKGALLFVRHIDGEERHTYYDIDNISFDTKCHADCFYDMTKSELLVEVSSFVVKCREADTVKYFGVYIPTFWIILPIDEEGMYVSEEYGWGKLYYLKAIERKVVEEIFRKTPRQILTYVDNDVTIGSLEGELAGYPVIL